LSHVDRRARRPATEIAAAPPARAAARSAPVSAAARHRPRVDVPRAHRARRVPPCVRRVHLRHRDMARFVPAVRALPHGDEPVAGHQRVRSRAIGLYNNNII